MIRVFTILYMFLSVQSFCQKRELGLQNIFNEQDIKGGILIYDLDGRDYFTNSKRAISRRSRPGTSFHLFNTLMFYHLGIVKDSTQAISWDNKIRYFNEYEIPSWNQDTYLAEAFRNGTDWYFKELSKDIELKLYRKFVRKSKYGKMMSGRQENNDFWNGGYGKVTIAMKEQIKFLRRFQKYDLPFSKSHIDAVKELMLEDSTMDYKLYGKVGLSEKPNMFSNSSNDIGWYSGYVDAGDNVYFFISYISKPSDDDREDFLELRRKVVYKALNYLFNLGIK